jgi:acyl-CoA thioesterase-1
VDKNRIRLLLFALVISIQIQSSGVFAQKKLIVLGDSLSEGYGVAKEAAYPSLLEKQIQNDLKKAYVVVNASVSGSTTASAPSRMKWVIKQKPDFVFIVLGGNDGLRGLKLTESEKNLSQAIELAHKENVKLILGGLYMPPNYGKEYTEQFKKMYIRLVKKYKVPFVPFVLEKVAGDPKYNLPDGIHPNEEGQKLIADTVYNAIKGLL